VLAGGVDVQRVALPKGRTQLRHAPMVQRLQVGQKPITQMRETTGGQDNTALLLQLGTDLLALLVVQIAGTAHVDDQIVAITLAVQNPPGQRLGAHERMRGIMGALLERLNGPE